MMMQTRFRTVVYVYRFGLNSQERVTDKEFSSYRAALEWIRINGDNSMSPMETYFERDTNGCPTSQPSFPSR